MKDTLKNILQPYSVMIESKKDETPEICTFTFSNAGNEKRSLLPGQYNMLGLPGYGEAAISFSSISPDNKSFIHTIRKAGNVTKAICALNVGDKLEIRGPFGNGWPLKKAEGKNAIVVAGGIGMAPLRPVIHALLKNKKKYKKLFLIYGSKEEEIILYKEELEAWANSGDIKVLLSVDKETDSCFLGLCHGLVTTLLDKIDVPLKDSVSYVCGSESMMRFVCKGLIERGQKPKDVYISMERRMKCAVGHCGHCQIGAKFVCKDGPVFAYDEIKKYADHLL